MASLAILDILKKKEYAPFCVPSSSFSFASYIYNDITDLVTYHKQLEVLQKYGCCSETSVPSNFDRGPSTKPAESDFGEASSYKIDSHGPEEDPSVETIKRYLHDYGPVWASGTIASGNERFGHVVAIVGYNDDSFEFLNSWGDQWGEDGFGAIPFNNLSAGPGFRIEKIRWVKNRTNPNPAHQFAARIRILTLNNSTNPEMKQYGRNVLRVKVGVEGEKPFVVWDRNNQYRGLDKYGNQVLNCAEVFDDSKYLIMDVPLPTYAPLHWPPSSNDKIVNNTWYLEVENHSSATQSNFFPSVDAIVTWFSVAGFAPTVQFDYAGGTVLVPAGQSKRLIVAPQPQVGSYHLYMTGFLRGNGVRFSGKLSRSQTAGGVEFNVPIQNARVVIRGIKYNPNGQPVLSEVVAEVLTNERGVFEQKRTNRFPAYQAFYKLLAKSELCEPVEQEVPHPA